MKHPMLKAAFVLAICSILASCGSSGAGSLGPASQVSVPAPAPAPDLSRTEAQVQKVEKKVDDVEDAVREVGSQLDAARISAKSIKEISEKAYKSGLEAGSVAAAELKAIVSKLQSEIQRSSESRENAMAALAETKSELGKAEDLNAKLRDDVQSIASQNQILFSKLEEANSRIRQAAKIADERDEAISSLAKTEERLKSAQKYVVGVWFAILLIFAWVGLKLLSIFGKITPQGKLARFFL